MFRNAPWSLAVDAIVTVAVMVAPTLMTASYQGEVMTVTQGKLMLDAGSEQVIVDVPSGATVLLDGKAAALTDLQTGFEAAVTATEQEGRIVASKVTATTGGVADGARGMFE